MHWDRPSGVDGDTDTEGEATIQVASALYEVELQVQGNL